ncbi:MAG: hypothetical protein ACAH06_07725 [Methylophilaceae bacterium]
MAQKYSPKKQSGLGQFIDSIFILVLVYVSLYIPLLLKPEAAEEAAGEAVKPTWELLNLPPVVQEQWVKLGYDAEKAAGLIGSRFDYTIDPLMLLITAGVIVGYFVFMIKVSDKQYREVIAEKFGDK